MRAPQCVTPPRPRPAILRAVAFAALLSPALAQAIDRTALAGGQQDMHFTRVDYDAFAACPEGSIDYAVMEKAPNLTVVRFSDRWSDLGGWDAVWREALLEAPSDSGVVTDGNSTAIDCHDVLLRSDGSEIGRASCRERV